MTFAWSQSSSRVDDKVATEMLRSFHAAGGTRVDTARIYAGGETEPMLGRALSALSPRQRAALTVGTKVHPSQTGGLSREGILSQVKVSKAALGDSVSISELYLHQPDPEHDLSETLRCTHDLVLDGTIKSVGLSNFHADEVGRCLELCEKHGWTKPSVYQGIYNPLNRAVEKQLLPLLRKFNMAFVAYNPLAAGLLTGKHKSPDEVAEGRFKNNTNYLPRFYTKDNFEAVQVLQHALAPHGISLLGATYRWLMMHSALNGAHDDGILLGASSVDQLKQNLAACTQTSTALPPDVLQAFEDAWRIVEKSVFPYWRSYSRDHPNGTSLDQGASYSAAKPK